MPSEQETAVDTVLTADQLSELQAAVAAGETWTPSGMHINYGESEDAFRGFNHGVDDAGAGLPCTPEARAPEGEPHRSAYVREYVSGWQFEMKGDLPWSPALPAVARWLATEGDDGLIALEAAARFWLMSPTRSHMPTIDAVVHRLIAALGEK